MGITKEKVSVKGFNCKALMSNPVFLAVAVVLRTDKSCQHISPFAPSPSKNAGS